jgi:uncharacterized iron-regulated membrane protein
MSLSATTFRIHRWLGWLIGVQVLIWVSGGVVFSLMPFKSWVKGEDTVKPPTVELHVDGHEPVIVPADGSAWSPPDEAALRRFAAGLHQAGATVSAVERVASVPLRLGIVAETAGRGNLWRLRFDDALSTRIYLDGRTGEFVTSRNEAWVWYDFFWRLHIMDYADGENFNGTLLRVASVAAWGLVIAGAVLAVLAIRRRWRVIRKPSRR